MEIVNIKVADLKPYAKNAKAHTADQIQHIMNSIKEYGFNVPICVRGEDNTIVYGHGRWLAAKKLRIEEVPCVRVDHLTEEQCQAYRIADNSTSMASGFDADKLNSEIDSLFNFNKADFGFGFSPHKTESDNEDHSNPSCYDTDKKSNKSGGTGKSKPPKTAQYRCPGCGHEFDQTAADNAAGKCKTAVGDSLDAALEDVLF